MLFPTYSVNGTPLQDSLGRWHEHPDMSVLPTFPGLRSASLSIAGVGGEYALPQASAEPVNFSVRVVVNAVDPVGVRPATYAARLQALRTNTQILLRDMRAASMTQGGTAEIRLYHTDQEWVIALGRLEASIESEFTPGQDHAVLTFVFRIPSGVWKGKAVTAKAPAATTRTTRIAGLASSTAPVDGPLVTLCGPFTGLTLTNQYGNGFTYSNTLTDAQAVTVNTAKWTVTEPFTITPDAETVPPSTGNYRSSPFLRSVGRASGVALTLLPEPSGAPLTVTGTGRGSTTAVHVSTSEVYF